MNDSEDGRATLVKGALTRGRIVQRMRPRRDASSMGRDIQEFSFGDTSVGDEIHRTLTGFPPPSPPAKLNKTPISVVLL